MVRLLLLAQPGIGTMAFTFTWKLLPVVAVYLWAVYTLSPALLPHFAALGLGSYLVRAWRGDKASKAGSASVGHPALEVAADLAALCFLEYGILQFRMEMDRGTWLGAAIGITIVTPVGCLVTRALSRFLLRPLIP
jgi:hypothetical protein